MYSKFHLAFKVPCLNKAKEFYCEVLGCDEGRSESGWTDINFFGNELTLHEFPQLKKSKLGTIKKRVEVNEEKVLLKPFIRFEGRAPEQETMFLCDPFDNIIEFKTMRNPESLWDKKS